MRKTLTAILFVLIIALLGGCNEQAADSTNADHEQQGENKAVEKPKVAQTDESTVLIKRTTPFEFGETVKPAEAASYENNDYGFSLKIPQSWQGHYIVYELDVQNNVWMKQPKTSIAFGMVEDGKFIGNLFLIAMLKDISADEVKAYYQDGSAFTQYLGANDDTVFVYSRPGEIPNELFQEAFAKTKDRFTHMIGNDVPRILKTAAYR